MESIQQISQNTALARKTWNWDQAERQKRIDAVAPFVPAEFAVPERLETAEFRLSMLTVNQVVCIYRCEP